MKVVIVCGLFLEVVVAVFTLDISAVCFQEHLQAVQNV
jgi:hypothetical protein